MQIYIHKNYEELCEVLNLVPPREGNIGALPQLHALFHRAAPVFNIDRHREQPKSLKEGFKSHWIRQ
jgi:hypothetical protein